jgi:hypothetical protein
VRVAWCFLLVLVACRQKNATVSFTIDNPTEAALTFSIDGTKYDLAPRASAPLTLKPGLHVLAAPLSGRVEFMVRVGLGEVLINPTFSNYVIAQQLYAVDAQAAKGFGSFANEVILEGVSFTGAIRLQSGLFIQKTWRYDVGEAFPDEVTVSGPGKGDLTNKIFRQADFVQFAEVKRHTAGRFERERNHRATDVEIELPKPLVKFQDASLEQKVAPLKSIYAEYARATDAEQQLRLQREYVKAQIAFTRETLGTSETQIYNALVLQMMQVFSPAQALAVSR